MRSCPHCTVGIRRHEDPLGVSQCVREPIFKSVKKSILQQVLGYNHSFLYISHWPSKLHLLVLHLRQAAREPWVMIKLSRTTRTENTSAVDKYSALEKRAEGRFSSTGKIDFWAKPLCHPLGDSRSTCCSFCPSHPRAPSQSIAARKGEFYYRPSNEHGTRFRPFWPRPSPTASPSFHRRE